jgi:hypothetical protein
VVGGMSRKQKPRRHKKHQPTLLACILVDGHFVPAIDAEGKVIPFDEAGLKIYAVPTDDAGRLPCCQ